MSAYFSNHQVMMLADLCCSKSSRSLLVHLGSWCYTVDGHVQDLARAHHSKQAIDIIENALEHLLLGRRGRSILGVKERMYYPIHVEVQVVESARKEENAVILVVAGTCARADGSRRQNRSEYVGIRAIQTRLCRLCGGSRLFWATHSVPLGLGCDVSIGTSLPA